MLQLLALWFVLLVALVAFAIGKPRDGGALILAYFLGLSLIHVPGVLAYLGSTPGSLEFDNTYLGFKATLLGMSAFVAGAISIRAMNGRQAGPEGVSLPAAAFERLGWRMIAGGIIAYFVLMPVAGYVPSLTSVISSMATMLILGFWLRLYGANVAHNQPRTIATLALMPLLPLGTLVMGGFIGYGINWVISVVAFLYVIARKRIWFYLATPLVVFLGLSLFVTYMGQRNGIRDVVWNQNAGLIDRFDRVSAIVTDFQLLDLNSPEHTDALDGRLNQNFLVGAGISRHDSGLSDYVYGATVPLWVIVPRAIWPDKPAVGGSGDLVGDFTGIAFAQGTSVGVGQVLEFYMDFGMLGVVLGFFVFGAALKWLDLRIMQGLVTGDLRQVVLFALPGLTLLQPGGALMEILIAMVGASVGANVLLYFKFFGGPAPRPSPARGFLPKREMTGQ